MRGDDDPVTELDLLAYVDGHLDPARRRIVEGYLAAHPEDARRVTADIAIADGIRRLFQGSFLETPPRRLASALDRPRRQVSRALAAMVALVIGAAGLAAGWWAAQTHATVAGPTASAPATIRTMSAGDGTDAVNWLANHVSDRIRLPDLRSAGFRLVQQSVVGGPGKPTVQLTFADERNQRIDLFLRPRVEDTRFRYEESDGRGLLSWTNGAVMFALTGDLSADRLHALAETVNSAPRAVPNPETAVPAGLLPVASGSAQ